MKRRYDKELSFPFSGHESESVLYMGGHCRFNPNYVLAKRVGHLIGFLRLGERELVPGTQQQRRSKYPCNHKIAHVDFPNTVLLTLHTRPHRNTIALHRNASDLRLYRYSK